MRIIQLSAIFPPEIGGPSTYVFESSKRLAQKGHKVYVATFGDKKFQKMQGFDVHRIKKSSLPGIISLPLRMLQFTLLALKLAKKKNVDLIYFHDLFVVGLPAILVRIFLRKKIVLKYVGDWAWEMSFPRRWTDKFLLEFAKEKKKLIPRLMFWWEKYLMASCEAVIVPSNFMKEVASCITKMPVKVIENAVEIKQLNETKQQLKKKFGLNEKTILLVGRFVKWKRFEDVFEAFPSILKKFPNSEIVLLGSGPEEKNLKELSKELGISEKVLFKGNVPHSMVFEYLKASDVFVLPSLYEGLSHILLEAKTQKVPVITTNVAGNKDAVINGLSGLQVNPKSPKGIEKAVLKIFSDPFLAGKLTANAFKEVSAKNTWEKNIAEFELFFKNLLEKN